MPAPWEPLDSLAVGRLLAWRLAENHQAELVRAAVAAKFGAEAAMLLSGRYPANAPAILDGPRPPAIPTTTAMAGTPPIAIAAQLPPSPPARKLPAGLEWLSASARRANSNNWVLANRRTKAGRPILANDPHLQIEFPSVWFEMHLVAADLDVVGVTIPGVPVVVLGHNARIAWGITNTNADVQDLAIERINVGHQTVLLPRRMGADRHRQSRHSRARAAASRCRSRCGRRATVPSSPRSDCTGTRRPRGCRPTIGRRRSGVPIRCAGM